MRAKSKSPASVAMGKCPECATDRPIGIVPQGTHLVWRLHVRRTLSGAGLECPASGVRVCDLPPVTLPGVTTPRCSCEGRP